MLFIISRFADPLFLRMIGAFLHRSQRTRSGPGSGVRSSGFEVRGSEFGASNLWFGVRRPVFCLLNSEFGVRRTFAGGVTRHSPTP